MNPRCLICGDLTEQLSFHDGIPDDLYRCPNACEIRPQIVIRQDGTGQVLNDLEILENLDL